VAFPALILNYLGQGAAVLDDPARIQNLFFQLAPDWFLVPLVILSTAATVIASQAVITGAFSLARQRIQLGLWPRLTVRHTSVETQGQVYVPLVNALLFAGLAASASPPVRLSRTAVFLSANARIPAALLHNLKHNGVLHEPTLLVSVVTHDVPVVLSEERWKVEDLGLGIKQVQLAYGFGESPEVARDLAAVPGLKFEADSATYFLGKESLVPTKTKGMAFWRKGLFVFLSRNALPATAFFGLPPGQVVELGGRSEF
jgi:K+ transporter